MADYDDMLIVRQLVDDVLLVLRWSAQPDATLGDDRGVETAVVPDEGLRSQFASAVEQLVANQGAEALRTLSGQNAEFPADAVIAALGSAGWDGAMRDFKLAVIELAGRGEVMGVVRGGGTIRRRIFRTLLAALNAALASLSAIPGASAIQELKDFLEKVLEREPDE
ncbi:hypothetical protein [Rhodococcus sp. UNC363MFTsu5.1]|uniref:hypothetical protein n=1 Tax=Rhodococcus sp. UNC363MFTsu5.1 TaxID=1449069 RepID=UPI0004837D99|nr:hypothetical protein [Rhodococcus sp. UNC363MFTsu5.1]